MLSRFSARCRLSFSPADITPDFAAAFATPFHFSLRFHDAAGFRAIFAAFLSPIRRLLFAAADYAAIFADTPAFHYAISFFTLSAPSCRYFIDKAADILSTASRRFRRCRLMVR
jgi:hypothetical protein